MVPLFIPTFLIFHSHPINQAKNYAKTLRNRAERQKSFPPSINRSQKYFANPSTCSLIQQSAPLHLPIRPTPGSGY